MSTTTTNLGLIIWDIGTDGYSHANLQTNWIALDGHDHTPGKGARLSGASLNNGAIGTTQLADGSVTTVKLADDAVTAAKIATDAVGSSEIVAGAVGTSELANGAVTLAKLDPNALPIGTVLSWYRPNNTVSLPTGWEVCDGRAWSGIPNAWGVSSGNIPDLRNRFILGAALTGTGSDTAHPPAIGSIGGSHTPSLGHSHTVDGHVHLVPGHNHSISVDGAHSHNFISHTYDNSGNRIIGGDFTTAAYTRTVAVPSAAGSRQALYIPGLNTSGVEGSDTPAVIETAAGHSHGGGTGYAGNFNTGFAGAGTSVALGAIDTRPQFIGLLFIMRVI